MSGKSSGTGVRLVVLLVVLIAAGAAFFYMQTRKPSLEDVQTAIETGELWGEPLSKAKEVFEVEPKPIPRQPEDSPSAERWLFKVHTNPPTYYLIFVQSGKVTQAQLADETGRILSAAERQERG